MDIVPHDNIQRPLDADVYDTLEFAALMFDGIGAGKFWKMNYSLDTGVESPVCIAGYVEFCGIINEWSVGSIIPNLDITLNDSALMRIFGVNDYRQHRLSWEDYCKLFNITRKENATT